MATSLSYEEKIKQHKELFKNSLRYSCPLNCGVGKVGDGDGGTYSKSQLKEHLIYECPNFNLECAVCGQNYKRSEFFDGKMHDCFGNIEK